MGADKARCLPLFYGMTGCDTVPSFNGIGKKKAWDVWHTFTEVTETFLRLSTPTCDLTVIDRAVLGRYGVLMCHKTSNCSDVNSARWYLFTKTGCQIDHTPPTSEALLQHCKRLFTRVAISGVKQTIQHQPFLIHLNGAGSLWVETGSFS